MRSKPEPWTMRRIIDANAAAGKCWFGRAEVVFFGSATLPHVFEGPGGIFFVTSEAMPGNPALGIRDGGRRFTVHQWHPKTADISTPGTFQEFLFQDDAMKDAKARARQWRKYAPPEPMRPALEVI